MKKYFNENKDVELIHATKSFEILESILAESSFRLKYCEEEFCLPKTIVSSRVHPMVSFTEQETNQLHKANITYGRYGVSLSPDWIIRNNIQPVMYIEKNSQVANALANLLRLRRRFPKGHQLRLPVITIACFTKNTIGTNSHTGESDFLFKNEKEWRYVPTKEQIGGWYISESKKKFISEAVKKKYNEKLNPHPLRFQIDDIIRIYCDTQKEAEKILEGYPRLKGKIEIAPWTYATPNRC